MAAEESRTPDTAVRHRHLGHPSQHRGQGQAAQRHGEERHPPDTPRRRASQADKVAGPRPEVTADSPGRVHALLARSAQHRAGHGEAEGEQRRPVEEKGQWGQDDDEQAQVGQDDDDPEVHLLEQHAQEDEQHTTLQVLEEELPRPGPAVWRWMPIATPMTTAKSGAVRYSLIGEHPTCGAEVRDEHRDDGETARCIESIEAAGGRHPPSLPRTA